jgi:transcriptional regulator with XRE-family HTH domain
MAKVRNRIRPIRERLLRSVGSVYSREAVARRIGVSVASLQRWEAGDTTPSVVDAMALARDLGVSVEQLGFRESE